MFSSFFSRLILVIKELKGFLYREKNKKFLFWKYRLFGRVDDDYGFVIAVIIYLVLSLVWSYKDIELNYFLCEYCVFMCLDDRSRFVIYSVDYFRGLFGILFYWEFSVDFVMYLFVKGKRGIKYLIVSWCRLCI